jgi:hypothetical protein
MPEKVFWIGDDADNKCVKVGQKLYERGQEIPAKDVSEFISDDMLKSWAEKGLVSIGANTAPVVIKDEDGIKRLEAEVRSLKADNDRMPGLEKELADTKAALARIQDGAKAKKLKELEAALKEKEERIATLEAEGKEKDELNVKQAAEIEELKKASGDQE